MSNQFGKIPLVSGQQILEDVGGTGLSGLVIGNESGLTCAVTLQGASVKKTLYPGTVDKFLVPKGRSWSGVLQIDPTSDLNNVISWPSSHIYVDTYGVNEEISGTYPYVLNRAGNIGNAVNFVSGSATSVQNDNNVAGTQVVEMSVLGSPTANDVHFNDGSGWVGRWINPTFTKVFQWFSAGATALQLGAVALLTEVLGALTVDGNLTVKGTSSLDNGAITTDGTGNETVTSLTATTLTATTLAATTINATTINATGNFNPLGNIILENAVPLQIENNVDAPVNILQVDASNNTQLFSVTGLDLIQMLSGAGVLGIIFDLVHKGLDIKTTAVSVVGVTNGSCTLYQFLIGTNVKAFLLYFNAYRNASGVSQTIALPVAFTTWAQWLAGNAAFITPRNAGSNLVSACRVLTALASGGGTNTTTSLLPPKSLGEIVQAFDGFDLGNSQGSNNTSIYFFVGQ